MPAWEGCASQANALLIGAKVDACVSKLVRIGDLRILDEALHPPAAAARRKKPPPDP